MAFAINTYNALIVHALVVHGTRMGLPQRAVFFSRTANYVIGGVQYTADDLEHGILRGNRCVTLRAVTGMPELVSRAHLRPCDLLHACRHR